MNTNKIVFWVFTLSTFLLLFSRFVHAGDGYLAFFADDFFYYHGVAQHTLEFGFSTFNGVVPTNGYHPLYQFLLVLIMAITGDGLIFFVAVTVLIFLLSIANYLSIFKIFTEHFNRSELLSSMSAFIMASVFLILIKEGMEIGLCLTFATLLVYHLTKKDTDYNKIWMYGLLMTLSRLDSIIFFGLIVLFNLKPMLSKNSWKGLLIYSAVFLSYIASNIYFFDTLLPVSGMAKQLKTSWEPSLYPFTSLFHFYPNKLFIVFIPFAALLLNIYFSKKGNSQCRRLTLATALFPLLLITFYMFKSTWFLWPWYAYMFYPALLLCFINVLAFEKRYVRNGLIALASFLLIWNLIYPFHKKPQDFVIYTNAKQFEEVEDIKGKRVAIGDRAGLFTYITGATTIQLEGLVMDRDYLENLKRMDLYEILEYYDAEYYIGTEPTKANNGSFIFKEPIQASELNFYITDTVYSEPLALVSSHDITSYLYKVSELESSSQSAKELK